MFAWAAVPVTSSAASGMASAGCKRRARKPEDERLQPLISLSALVGARDAHIFPVLRDRAASDLDALRLEDAGDLLVGQRPGGIFVFDQLLDAAFEDEER